MIITEHTGVMSSVTEDGIEPGKRAKVVEHEERESGKAELGL